MLFLLINQALCSMHSAVTSLADLPLEYSLSGNLGRGLAAVFDTKIHAVISAVHGLLLPLGVLNTYQSHMFASRIDPESLLKVLREGTAHLDFASMTAAEVYGGLRLWVSKLYSDELSGSSAIVLRGYRTFGKLAKVWHESVIVPWRAAHPEAPPEGQPSSKARTDAQVMLCTACAGRRECTAEQC